VLATIVADSSGSHDTLCGMTPDGQSAMLLAAIKHGLDIRDVAPSASFFKGVRVDAAGALQFTGSAGPGAAVDLLIHLPVVVALVNAPHPLDPDPSVTGLDVLAWRAPEASWPPPSTTSPNTCGRCSNTESTWASARNL